MVLVQYFQIPFFGILVLLHFEVGVPRSQEGLGRPGAVGGVVQDLLVLVQGFLVLVQGEERRGVPIAHLGHGITFGIVVQELFIAVRRLVVLIRQVIAGPQVFLGFLSLGPGAVFGGQLPELHGGNREILLQIGQEEPGLGDEIPHGILGHELVEAVLGLLVVLFLEEFLGLVIERLAAISSSHGGRLNGKRRQRH